MKNVKDDYAWMFDEETRGGCKSEYLEDITVIAIRSSNGSYGESVIYDLDRKHYNNTFIGKKQSFVGECRIH